MQKGDSLRSGRDHREIPGEPGLFHPQLNGYKKSLCVWMSLHSKRNKPTLLRPLGPEQFV